jgi:hypothetical protein
MDARLRILKRLSLSNPEAKERYIAELERIAGGLDSSGDLIDVCQDINDISDIVEKTLIQQGTWYPLRAGVDVNFWVEREFPEKAEGLCIAESTRDVASAIVNYFTMSGFKTWSADPIVYLENPYSIFTWEITK